VSLSYSVNGVAQAPVAMTLASGVYQRHSLHSPTGRGSTTPVTGTAGVQHTRSAWGTSPRDADSLAARIDAQSEPLYTGYTAERKARSRRPASAPARTTTTPGRLQRDQRLPVERLRRRPSRRRRRDRSVQVLGRIGFNGGRLRLDITSLWRTPPSPFGVVVLARTRTRCRPSSPSPI